MPTLPADPEPPAGPVERISEAVRRTVAVAGGTTWTLVRLILWMSVLGVGASYAPFPWPQVAVVALLGLVFDVVRLANKR